MADPTRGMDAHQVSEETRIKFTKQLHRLREEDIEEIAFPATLGSVERKFLHSLAEQLGLKSISRGRGEQRHITVFKEKAQSAEDISQAGKRIPVSLKGPQRSLLEQHLNTFPEAPVISLQACNPPQRGRRQPIDFERVSTMHQRSQEQREAHPRFQEIQQRRKTLPSFGYCAQVCDLVAANQIVLISGETGCGKTTQVPQFLLDHPVMGPTAKILVTQPRRISAITVAERIAEERSEGIGSTIGYNIRLEREESAQTQVLFVTPGVLLRKLETDPFLDSYTHVIIDEAHERDRFTDFTMIVIKDILPVRPDLKLILMSATLQTNKLASFFGGCPQLHIGSSVFPVQEYFLEDALRFTEYVSTGNGSGLPMQAHEYTCALCGKGGFKVATELGAHAAMCFGSRDASPKPKLTTNLLSRLQQAASLAGRSTPSQSTGSNAPEVEDDDEVKSVASVVSDVSSVADAIPSISSGKVVAPEEQESDEILNKYFFNFDDDTVDLGLIVALLEYVFSSEYGNEGSVLVFLPGWDDISRLGKQLRYSSLFSNPHKFRILPLHSGIPKSRQKEVFQPTPAGVHKIVLSTNIAETSITIDDITVVIDSGRVKEQTYDPHTKLATLQPQWISQSSAKQRKGRAGRTRAGVCFHLFSRRRHASLPVQQDSELLRMPLEEVCLQAKSLGVASRTNKADQNGDLDTFLSKAMDAPHPLAITNAIVSLKNIGCLTDQERITPLGVSVSKFAMHPRLGRMLLFGLLCGCPHSAIKAACAVAGRDPFVIPMDEVQKRQAMAAKFALSYGYRSDQLSLVTALNLYTLHREKMGFPALVSFCDDNFLSMSSLSMMSDVVDQTSREVHDLKVHLARPDRNENDMALLVSLTSVALYPHYAIRTRGQTNWFTEKGRRARLHNSSVNNMASSQYKKKCVEDVQVLAYQDLLENKSSNRIAAANLVMLNTTPMPVLLLVLMADNIHELTAQEQSEMDAAAAAVGAGAMGLDQALEAEEEGEDENLTGDDDWDSALQSISQVPQQPQVLLPVDEVDLRIDGWMRITCPRSDWLLLQELRRRIHSALAHICMNPSTPMSAALQQAVDVFVQLMTMTQQPPLPMRTTSDLSNPERSGRGGGRGRERGEGRGGRGRGGQRGRGQFNNRKNERNNNIHS